LKLFVILQFYAMASTPCLSSLVAHNINPANFPVLMEVLYLYNRRYLSINSMKNMRISIGNDHAGTECKKFIAENLEKDGHELLNHGTDDPDSVDYPDFVHPVARDVTGGKVDLGIVICGSGNGVAMTANKHRDIRAALCWDVELAKLARQHNNANVLAIPARFVSNQLALEMVRAFLTTEFEGGRHSRRVEKISKGV